MGRAITGRDTGFSLLEMVVVVAVIAVLSVSASMAVTRRGTGALGDAQRFQSVYDRLRDSAILANTPRALLLAPEGWLELVPAVPEQPDTTTGVQSSTPATPPAWQVSGRLASLRGEARFQSGGGPIGLSPMPAEPARATPQLIFLPDGQVTPFTVSFIAEGEVTRCTGNGWTGLSCEGP